MMTPDDIDVWVGLDVGKSAHHAHALDHDGNTLYDKPLKQDEKAIICLARRRCDVIYSMLKNGTLYQEPALVA